MSGFFIFTLIFLFQDPPQNLQVWEEIAQVEKVANLTVAQSESQYAIANTNPSRGYYVSGQGVILVVPLRYRSLSRHRPQEANQTALPTVAFEKNLTLRLAKWREQNLAADVTREANFEKLLRALKKNLPHMMSLLAGLASGEGLVMVVEEAPPIYFSTSYWLKKNPTRKVVTLSIDSEMFQLVKTSKTELPIGWIKQTTANRALVANP